uniref:Putative secreted protein n=1 Tax=Anopheles darlingi TaxID=43151 RepID=A0A2M4DEL2_ANODA
MFSSVSFTSWRRGLRLASFLAAASIEAAAPSSSFSAITVGSSGSTHSEPFSSCAIPTRSVTHIATRRDSCIRSSAVQ